MKTLVFNGSPKRDKSDTMHITNAFLAGMGEKCKNETTVINVIDKNIEYCRGCFCCMRDGGKCVYNDDMCGIPEKIIENDVVIFSFPLYCYGIPAPLKNLIDRTLPLSTMAMKKVGERYEHICKADYSHIRFVMICGCGFPNSKHNFEPVSQQFKLMFPNNCAIITVPESPMFSASEAEEVTKPRLDAIQRAGREYAENNLISMELLNEITSPMISEAVYERIVNGGL